MASRWPSGVEILAQGLAPHVVPTGLDTQAQPTSAQLVRGRGLLGHQRGLALVEYSIRMPVGNQASR